jgi:hypothetical protein
MADAGGGMIHLYTFDRASRELQPKPRVLDAKLDNGGAMLAFSPAGDRLVLRGWGGEVHLFDVQTGRRLFSTHPLRSSGYQRLCFNLSGRGQTMPRSFNRFPRAALSAVLVSECMTSAAPTGRLVAATVDAAAAVAAGKTVVMATSAKIAALTEGVLKTMFLTKLTIVSAVLCVLGLMLPGIGGLCHATFATSQSENREEAQPENKKSLPDGLPDARLLVEKARELDAAKARHRQAEALLKEAQKKLVEAQNSYEQAQDSYEAAKIMERPITGTTITGKLVKVAAADNSVRLEYWKEPKEGDQPSGFGVVAYVAYENFLVAKDAVIIQDNAKTTLADLTEGSHIALKVEGQRGVRLTVDGGVVGGPIRYVSADEARNTIAVVAGRKDERRIYHLVKETEVVTTSGKPARVKDLKAGTLLLLTRSVADTNTAIRIEILPRG